MLDEESADCKSNDAGAQQREGQDHHYPELRDPYYD